MSPYLKISAAVLLSGLIFTACSKEKDATYPATPELTYRSMSTDQVSYHDTSRWVMRYDFVDGDGDIGRDFTDSKLAVTIINKTTNAEYKYPFPYVPEEARFGKKYLKGSGTVSFAKNVFFIPRADSIHMERDTFIYDMYVTDEAGNRSNTITTPPIYITP